MTAIEIVSYDGEYPNLCFGRLKLKADGKEYVTSPGVLCPGGGPSATATRIGTR